MHFSIKGRNLFENGRNQGLDGVDGCPFKIYNYIQELKNLKRKFIMNKLVDLKKEREIKAAEYMRTFKVTKSNEFIRDSRFDLTATEQKLIYYIISRIEPDDTEFRKCAIDLGTFCRICNNSTKGSMTHIKKVAKALRDKSIWIEPDEGVHTTLSWVSQVTVNEKKQLIEVTIAEEMRPYLLELRSNFTSYQLGDILQFKCKYSNWVYDNILCYAGEKHKKSGEWEVSVETMRTKNFLNCENFKDIRRRIIEPAIKDINSCTRIMIDRYGTIKEGRKVDRVVFYYRPKTDEEILNMRNPDNDFVNEVIEITNVK